MISAVTVRIERNINREQMAMPNEQRASSTSGLIENHAYVDVRGVDIAEARDVIDEEAKLLRQIACIPADQHEYLPSI